jgi:hypothetical protein
MADDIEVNGLIDSKAFAEQIELTVKEKRLDYIDAVVYYCEKNSIDIETAADLIKSNTKLKVKVRLSAEDNNYLPKTATLPI